MPRSTSRNRSPNLNGHVETYGDLEYGIEKFPDFDIGDNAKPLNHTCKSNEHANRSVALDDQWLPRRDGRVKWVPKEQSSNASGHGRQKSITNAIRNIRAGSVGQNAHEIADALRAPVSWKLIVWSPTPMTYKAAILIPHANT
jgi:solute carrier family 35 protein E1